MTRNQNNHLTSFLGARDEKGNLSDDELRDVAEDYYKPIAHTTDNMNVSGGKLVGPNVMHFGGE